MSAPGAPYAFQLIDNYCLASPGCCILVSSSENVRKRDDIVKTLRFSKNCFATVLYRNATSVCREGFAYFRNTCDCTQC